MAQTLVEDRSYNLSSCEEDLKNKKVYYVKLTDSCLKAVEEFLTYKGSLKTQPRIKFEGKHGVISIPTKPGSASQDVRKKFHFGVSSLNLTNSSNNPNTPLQGVTECIKHPDRRGTRLVSYGLLESKISIAATEDVYENTRNRMAQVDAERKDVRTKEIKLGSMKKGKHQSKAKIITPDTVHKPPLKKKVIPPTHKTASPSTIYSSSNNASKSSPASGKSFSCRERVIHILALRPHKKPELMSRLFKEAMSQKDRNNLAMVLQQVSSIQDNQYKLHSHLYGDIQVDTWPFYNESERNTVKKNIAQHKKLDHSSSPQVVSSTSKSPEEKAGTKRPMSTDVTMSTNTSKRTKNSQYEEPSSTVSSSKPTTTGSNVTTKDNHPKEQQKSPVKAATVKTVGEDSPPPMVASTSDSPEYLTTYKQISSYEQRCQYKRDFQAEYPEYMKLKKSVDAVTSRFIELDQSWRKTEKGSDKYKRLQDEIVQAYEKLKDDNYHEMKTRCDELQQKLSHIKKLVVEYDNACLAT